MIRKRDRSSQPPASLADLIAKVGGKAIYQDIKHIADTTDETPGNAIRIFARNNKLKFDQQTQATLAKIYRTQQPRDIQSVQQASALRQAKKEHADQPQPEQTTTVAKLLKVLGEDGIRAGFESFMAFQEIRLSTDDAIKRYAANIGITDTTERKTLAAICYDPNQHIQPQLTPEIRPHLRTMHRILLLRELGMARSPHEAIHTLQTLKFVSRPNVPNPEPATYKSLQYNWISATSREQRAQLEFDNRLPPITSTDPAEVTEILLARAASGNAELDSVLAVFDMVDEEQLATIEARYAQLLAEHGQEMD